MLLRFLLCFFFFKQKTAYEMRISDWSSDVCSSDLAEARLDGGKLIVAGRRSPREVGDGACIHPDLLGEPPRRRAPRAAAADDDDVEQIGRASCRERVCQYV